MPETKLGAEAMEHRETAPHQDSKGEWCKCDTCQLFVVRAERDQALEAVRALGPAVEWLQDIVGKAYLVKTLIQLESLLQGTMPQFLRHRDALAHPAVVAARKGGAR